DISIATRRGTQDFPQPPQRRRVRVSVPAYAATPLEWPPSRPRNDSTCPRPTPQADAPSRRQDEPSSHTTYDHDTTLCRATTIPTATEIQLRHHVAVPTGGVAGLAHRGLRRPT